MSRPIVQNPWLATRRHTGAQYDAPYEADAAKGIDVHGEANLVEKLLHSELNRTGSPGPFCVLDAGCGTGRTGIELARRRMKVVGVDLDPVMLERAQHKAPQLDWRQGDLSTIELNQHFDAIVMAGNVMIYLTPGSEAATLMNMARYLKPGGLLVSAFELTHHTWSNLTIESFDLMSQESGLSQVARWSTWDQRNWLKGDNYAVTVHTK